MVAGSIPVIVSSWPCTIAASERTCETCRTPSTAASASPSAALNGMLLLAVDDVVGVHLVGDRALGPGAEAGAEHRHDVTSVSPIISAAAVEAVRPGLRTALAPASSPATPPTRRAGQPTTRASGFTSRGASSAMPGEQRRARRRRAAARRARPLTPPNTPSERAQRRRRDDHAEAGLVRTRRELRRRQRRALADRRDRRHAGGPAGRQDARRAA